MRWACVGEATDPPSGCPYLLHEGGGLWVLTIEDTRLNGSSFTCGYPQRLSEPFDEQRRN